MKKIIIFFLCLAIINPFSTCFAMAAGEFGESIDDAIALLSHLEIISQYDDGTYGIDESVTRAEMAVIIARMCRINENEIADKQYYLDMPSGHWAAFAVNTLAERGILSPDTYFRPDDPVNINEAVKIFVCALGYGVMADSKGGYPAGHLSVANKLDLLDEINLTDSNLLRGDIIVMAYNALDSYVMDIGSVSNGELEYVISKDKTLLNEYWDMNICYGTLTGAWGVDLYNKKDIASDEAYIDNISYKTDMSNISDYLGCEIKALCYSPRNSEKDKIVMIFPENDTVKTVVKAEDIVSYKNYNLTYFSGNKEKIAKLPSDVTIVRNGEIVKQGYTEAFDLYKGTVNLIDADRNGVYETVLIKSAESDVISQISDTQIFFKNLKEPIDLKSSALKIRTADGENLELSSLSEGNVLTVFRSDDYVELYVSSKTVTGVIESIVNSRRELIFDDNIYTVDKLLWENKNDFFTPGKSITFKTDIYDEIIYAEPSGDSAYKFGYVIGSAYGKGLKAEVTLKLYSEEGMMEEVRLSEDVTVDKKKYKSGSAEQLANIFSKPQLIRFIKNDEGKISNIDSLNKGDNEWSDTLTLSESLSDVKWYSSPKLFGPKIIVDKNTVVFSLPDDAVIASADESLFHCGDYTYMPWGGNCRAESYKTNPDNLYADVVIVRTGNAALTMSDSRNGLLLVDTVSRGLNEDGEEVYIVRGIRAGAETELTTYNSNPVVDYVTGTAVEPGDVIEMELTYDSKIVKTAIIYDYSKAEKPSWAPLSTGDFYNERNYIYGYIKKKHANVMDYSQVGEDCAKIIAHTQYAAVSAIIIYK